MTAVTHSVFAWCWGNPSEGQEFQTPGLGRERSDRKQGFVVCVNCSADSCKRDVLYGMKPVYVLQELLQCQYLLCVRNTMLHPRRVLCFAA